MGHPRALLDKIADDVRRTYPEPKFSYVYAKALNLTDHRNQPESKVFRMTRTTQLCGARDPEADDPVECDFLLGHDGPCSWELERDELERQCSQSELERERRQRAARRSRQRKAG